MGLSIPLAQLLAAAGAHRLKYYYTVTRI